MTKLKCIDRRYCRPLYNLALKAKIVYLLREEITIRHVTGSDQTGNIWGAGRICEEPITRLLSLDTYHFVHGEYSAVTIGEFPEEVLDSIIVS